MALKKSDKIIAVIGVIILIVAAVGIYVYAGVEEEEDIPDEPEEMYFAIKYDEISVPVYPDNEDYTIKAKLLGAGKYEGMVKITQQNLKSVDLFVEYHDNKIGLLLNVGLVKLIGADTITITIYDGQETEIAQDKIKGSGNISIPIFSNGPMIMMDPIQAEDINDANTMLQNNFIDYDETYTIHISLKTGLWGKIREWLLGKDKFELGMSYTYYDYYIEEEIPGGEPDDELPPTGENQGSQTWLPLTYTGKH